MKYLTTALLITALAGAGMGVITPVMANEHGKRGMHHDGGSWKSTLNEAQTKQIDQLKLNYKKKVYPIKAKIKQTKVELALLITAKKPNQKGVEKKIDEVVKLKAKKMRHKAAYKIEVRKVLNAEQRVQFDIKLLKKAYHGKKKGRRYSHH